MHKYYISISNYNKTITNSLSLVAYFASSENCLQMYQFCRCLEHEKQNCDVHYTESFATLGEIWRHDWRSACTLLPTDFANSESI